jgi:sec-independent protein translocase protein TatA
MGSFSIWHWLIVLLVIALLFGAGRISGVMGDVGKGIKSFKKGLSEDDEPDAAKPQSRIADERTPEPRATSAHPSADLDKR